MGKLQITVFLSKLSRRERFILYGAGVFVIVMLLDRAVLAPIFFKINSLDEQIAEREELIKNSLVILSEKDKIKELRDKYSLYLSEPEPEEIEVTSFLKEAENLAKDSSVYLINIRPAGKSKNKTSKEYYVDLDFEAQMEQVFNFFHAIKNSNGLLKIQSYYIKPKAVGSSIIACSMSISKTILKNN